MAPKKAKSIVGVLQRHENRFSKAPKKAKSIVGVLQRHENRFSHEYKVSKIDFHA